MITDIPPALPAHTVTLILAHLSPLDRPIPPHLLSAPLRQRHHFLGLADALDTPQDAAAYLSWPSPPDSDSAALRLVDLLGALPSAETFDPLLSYPTKYSCDGETVYAHAFIPVNELNGDNGEGLRLVFRWEAIGHVGNATNADGWKYHDAKHTSFPPGIYDSPEAAFSPATSLTPHAPQSPPFMLNAQVDSDDDDDDDDDDDAYWNSYGRSGSDDEEDEAFNPSRSTAASAEADDEKAEDAYWAQYTSVHGTADSTRPSPFSQKRKLHDPVQPFSASSSADSAAYYDARCAGAYDRYDIEHIEHLHHFADLRDDASPGALCPMALARRLHAISPRMSLSPSESSAPVELELELGTADAYPATFDSPESPQTSDGRTLTPPADNLSARPLPPLEQLPFGAVKRKAESVVDDDDAGLRDAIKGMYRLWAAARGNRLDDMKSAADERDEFVHIVCDVVHNL